MRLNFTDASAAADPGTRPYELMSSPALRSWNAGVPWRAGSEWTRAVCASGGVLRGRTRGPDEPPHEAPAALCSCGLYAARDLRDVWAELSVTKLVQARGSTRLIVAVPGVAELVGRAWEHERGWRASAARPLAILDVSRSNSMFDLWNPLYEELRPWLGLVAAVYGVALAGDAAELQDLQRLGAAGRMPRPTPSARPRLLHGGPMDGQLYWLPADDLPRLHVLRVPMPEEAFWADDVPVEVNRGGVARYARTRLGWSYAFDEME
jgi:hypothetical protein